MDGDLEKKAELLLTESGYLNAMADLFVELSSLELTRDQTSAAIGARRCLQSFLDARVSREFEQRHRELLAAHKETQFLLRQQQGAGVTSFDREGLQIPSRVEQEDSQD